MTDHRPPAPTPIGDVVPGDPPVPITVWPVPPPPAGDTMSNGLGVRLVHNLTHPGQLIIDLTDGPQLARAIIAARRRSHLQSPATVRWGKEKAALIVTGWPAQSPAHEFFTACRAKLRPGAAVAVLLPHTDPAQPADIVAAARTAQLTYLQHIVAATETGTYRRAPRLDIHTDVLILTRPGAEAAADA